jgi:hypothetical protein
MANLASGDGGSGTTTEEEEPTGDPYQGAQTGSSVYRPGSGGSDDDDDSSSSSSGSGSSDSDSRTTTSRAEQIKRKAAEAAGAAADGVDSTEGVDKSKKSRNKEIADRAQRAAEMAPPTDHTLETMDQKDRVTEMARASGDPFAGAQTGSSVYRPGSGGSDDGDGGDSGGGDSDGRPFDGVQAGSDVYRPGSGGDSEPGSQTGNQPSPASDEQQQGVEVSDSVVGDQAADFEDRILNQYPGLNEDDVAIRRDGDQLVAEFTPSGRDKIQDRLERSARGAARAVESDPGFQAAQEREAQNRQEQFVQSIRGKARAVEEDTGENPMDVSVNSPRQQNSPVNPQTAEKIQREEFEQRLEREYPDREFTIRRTEDGFEAVPQEQEEQFGDFDWSFGFGGPEDEVERSLEDASETITETSRDVGEFLFQKSVSGESAGAAALRLAGADNRARQYDDAVRSLGRGVIGDGGGAIADVPGLLEKGMEAVEYVGYFGSRAAAGEGADASTQTFNRAKKLASVAQEEAAENPFRTTGALIGALVSSYGVLKTARTVGPRTSTAARYAIQPGEEIAGTIGYRTVKAARGTKAAQRTFPNKEPLIFSEEAALRAGSKVSSRLRDVDVSPGRRVRSAAGELQERTPTARVVRDPDSGLVSVDAELAAEIGESARKYRDAFAERVGSEPRGTRDLRAGADLRPEQAVAQSRRSDVKVAEPQTRRETVGGLVKGAQRPSIEGQLAGGASRTARRAQGLLESVRERPQSFASDARRGGVGGLVQGAQRPSIEADLVAAGGRARQAVNNFEVDVNTDRVGSDTGPDGVATLVAGAQGPSLEGQASRAANVLAFETRRRRLQAQQAASDLPGQIADARRRYAFALRSDVAEKTSGLDTRYRQARSLVSDAELPGQPSAEGTASGLGVRNRLSGLGDLTLRLEPSARYWDAGGQRVPNRVDTGDFDGFDVEGVLGDVDVTQNVETETDTDTDVDDLDPTDRDAGDGLVAVEAESEMADPVDTSRTGTGTDSTRRARELPVTRPAANAVQPAEPREYAGVEDALPAGSELVDTRPEARERSIPSERTGLDVEQGLGVETELGVEQALETEQEQRQRYESETETEVTTRLDTEQETEAEAELETESENELEPEGRGGSDPFRPDDRDFGFERGGRSADPDRGLGAGWFNEFVTAFAMGAGPREVAASERGGAVELTEQRQTVAQAEGGEDIMAAEAAFAFEGLGVGLADDGDSGGGDSWFEF